MGDNAQNQLIRVQLEVQEKTFEVAKMLTIWIKVDD